MKRQLFENKWVSLWEVVEPDKGVNGYVYSHETRCQGRIVAVLPFKNDRLFLLKFEVTPCWGMEPVVSAVTGGYEGEDIADDAVREVLEETGYTITKDELIPLGTCFGTKSTDTVYYLYAVDVTDKEQGVAMGDGSRIESESKTVWADSGDIAKCNDPIVSTMYVRLVAE